jgi:hypothetical protein
MSYRPLFIEALRRIEQAGRLAAAKGGRLPVVIVGGSAVELSTAGAITSGDIDICEGDEALEAALLEVGFSRETRAGHLLRGYYMETPDGEFGVELVSGSLFDNRSDRQRLRFFAIDIGGQKVLAIPPIEDLIADRLAQYEANPSGHDDMLEQARIMAELAGQLDSTYLKKRVAEECLDGEAALWALHGGAPSRDG